MILAAVLGGVSALAGIAFFEGAGIIHQMIGIAPGGGQNLLALAIAPAVAGFLCALLKKHVNGGFCGLSDTMLAAQRGDAQPWKSSLASVVASFTAFGGGASVGQYGPVGHLGGVIGGYFRKRWGRGIGPACGVAAAIAAAFNAPVTGVLFAHEVILRHHSARAFAPVAVAAIAGYMVSVGVFSRPPFLSIGDMRSVNAVDFVLFGVQGALFGVLSAFYLRAIFALGRKLSPLPTMPLFIVAGGVCGLLWLIAPEAVGGRELLRLVVEDGITGWQTAATIGAVKVAATILCLGAGFAGGVVSPTLVIGAMTGVLYATTATALGVYDGPLFVPVVCGMMAFVAPALGAPLAAILFVLELSGGNYPLTLAASLSVALSMLTAGKLGKGSYYEQQLLSRGVNIKNDRESWDLMAVPISDLLSTRDIPSINITTSAADAVKIMAKKSALFACITGANDKYAGIMDLAAAARGGDSTCGECMRAISPLRQTDNLAAALDACDNSEDSFIPVVDDNDNLVGVLRETDLFHARDRSRLRRVEETE